MRRVAVSAIGVVSPLGNSAAELYRQAHAGRSGIQRLERPFAHRLTAPLAATAQIDGALHFDPPQLRMLDRFSLMALLAARQAIDAAQAADVLRSDRFDRQRAGVFIGTGMGGSQSMDEGYQALYGAHSDRDRDRDRIKPFTVLMGMHNAAAAWIGIEHGFTGPNLTYSTACSSSAVAIGEAWLRVAGGQLDMAIAGGAEAPLSFGSLKAWEALHTLARIDDAEPSASCKPFSLDRSGMVLGEGAVMLLLEPWAQALERGAPLIGEIIGYGATNEASHITRPGVDGQAAAMRAALRSAGLAPEAIDAINAHGTGTQANDATETAAIKAVFGARASRIPVSATKSMHGHLLGAAGALECALSLLAMQHGTLLPTMHLHQPDPLCDLDCVPNAARDGVAVRTMLSNSFAFGGSNAVLALRAAT